MKMLKKLKKRLFKLGFVALILLVGLIVCLTLFLGTAIKKGVETVGSQLTKTDIRLEEVKLSLLSGRGEIRGLVVGNPKGYKTDMAMTLGNAKLSLAPTSLLSDKVIIRSFVAEAPEITFEGGFKDNNLSKILDNVKSVTRDASKKKSKEPKSKPETKGETKAPGQTKLQVDELLMSGAKLHVSLSGMGGTAMVLPLPNIELRNLGQGEEGITVAELVQEILKQVSERSAKVVVDTAADPRKAAADALDQVTKELPDAVGKAVNEIGDLLKKKE